MGHFVPITLGLVINIYYKYIGQKTARNTYPYNGINKLNTLDDETYFEIMLKYSYL